MVMERMPSTGAEPGAVSVHAGGSRDEEMTLVRHILIGMCVCIPILVLFWVGLVAFAVTLAGVGYLAPLLMAVVIGVLAGAFFGAWIGFVVYSRTVD